jgi:hypothetical protein
MELLSLVARTTYENTHAWPRGVRSLSTLLDDEGEMRQMIGQHRPHPDMLAGTMKKRPVENPPNILAGFTGG